MVVVGIDGSPGAEAALAFAVEEARLRQVPLRIVCAWEASASSFVGEAFAATPDCLEVAEQHAEEILRAALAAIAPAKAEALAVEGPAAQVLVEQAAGATILVVGSRGRGAAASLILGSVSGGIAHHARCPVLIVPAKPENRPAA